MAEYGRRTPIEKLRGECYRTNKGCVIFIPILLVLLAAFVRLVCGSPVQTLHSTGAGTAIMPVWLMVLLFALSYAVAGLSLGLALGSAHGSREARKYQGAMWFCISLALGYAWYPIFFCARLFLVSVIVSALCLFSSVCACISFSHVSKISCALSVLYNCWLTYLLLLNIRIFLSI